MYDDDDVIIVILFYVEDSINRVRPSHAGKEIVTYISYARHPSYSHDSRQVRRRVLLVYVFANRRYGFFFHLFIPLAGLEFVYDAVFEFLVGMGWQGYESYSFFLYISRTALPICSLKEVIRYFNKIII